MQTTNLKEICEDLGLGPLCGAPVRVSGGLLHAMYRVRTERRTYAVKLLNPHIMERPTAMGNYREAERLEGLLEERKLPILAAMAFDGTKMQQSGGQYFYVFPWFDGRALGEEEIRPAHCRRIGEVLAQIHQVPVRQAAKDAGDDTGRAQPALLLEEEWEALCLLLTQTQRPDAQALAQELSPHLPLLRGMEEAGRRAVQRLPKEAAICHGDMDSKNVLWQGDTFRIIDLECLSAASPAQELYETALSWSGLNECRFDPERFRAFTGAYAAAGGRLPQDWEVLYAANVSRLDWLRYSVKRVLGIGCGPQEREVGLSEAQKTLRQILYYDRIRENILQSVL